MKTNTRVTALRIGSPYMLTHQDVEEQLKETAFTPQERLTLANSLLVAFTPAFKARLGGAK
jgi:hypothetical protein